MSFQNCVNRGVQGGMMDAKRAETILSEYNNLFRQFSETMGPTSADVEAAKLIVQKTKGEAKEKRRVMQLQAATSRSQLERMAQHKNIRGELSPGDYVQDMISNKRGAGGSTIAGLEEVIKRNFRREMTQALRTFSGNLVGMRRNKGALRLVTREIFGEDTGDAAAKAMAMKWAQIAERARTRYNAAGGHIGKRADWGLPQAHDTTRVRRAGYDAWREYMIGADRGGKPRLDFDAMGKDFNNGIPFTPETLEALLKDAYEAIRTDGYSRRDPSSRHGSAMYNRRADHRFFKFADAKDWMDYSERFGAGEDTFRIMISHLDNMANEIALMEGLGPNPTTGFAYLKDAAMSMSQRSADAEAPKVVQQKLTQADNMMDLFTGRTNIPGNVRFAKGMSAVRQYLTSAHLGSAVISSINDFGTQRTQARFLGMAQFGYMKQMQRLMRDGDFRNEANEAGLVFENAINLGNAVARYDMEGLQIETAARLADFTIRSSGLGYLTEIQRQSFGLEFMKNAANTWTKSSHADLDPKIKRVFEGYGIGAREWGVIQRAPKHKMSNGLEIIRAQEIEGLGFQDVADKYMEAIVSLTEFAVPSTDLYGRAMVLGKAQAGTIAGEFVRSGLQFKAFPITILTTQLSRIINEAYSGRKRNAMSYAASFFITSTLLGAVAIQLKEVVKGKDPRDMADPKFVLAAMAQGGGLGLFGDFLFSDVNRFGGGPVGSLLGPTAGAAADVLKFTVGNAQELITGEATNAGREFTQLLRNYTPGGSLWYLRLAYEREILDQLQLVLDPKARSSFQAKRGYARDTGTQFFSEPGRRLSDMRTPDLSNAFGGQ